MDVTKVLAELRDERDRLDETIVALERLATGRGKRRGRPPRWLSQARKGATSSDDVKNASRSRVERE